MHYATETAGLHGLEANFHSPSPHLTTETVPVSETLCFLVLEFLTVDKVQKPSNSER
jgi:hypothetical protein